MHAGHPRDQLPSKSCGYHRSPTVKSLNEAGAAATCLFEEPRYKPDVGLTSSFKNQRPVAELAALITPLGSVAGNIDGQDQQPARSGKDLTYFAQVCRAAGLWSSCLHLISIDALVLDRDQPPLGTINSDRNLKYDELKNGILHWERPDTPTVTRRPATTIAFCNGGNTQSGKFSTESTKETGDASVTSSFKLPVSWPRGQQRGERSRDRSPG